ncbi:MAG: class I SAM-dependent methyltransferase [Cyanothece sp. SIO1E1]|nr:class I SAM-dependent methyltransferase [Cyanothece sp. SIO1E1]
MGNREYDGIADAYKDSKKLSFRKYIEEYTLFKLLDNISGKEVLDLACGEGFYTRKIKQTGARYVLGVDISSEMIALAKKQEEIDPIGCQYLLHDVSTLELRNKVDIVTGVYLMNYAKSADELLQFCKVVYDSLKPGGMFIGFNDNVAANPNLAPSFQKYGFEKTTSVDQSEGDVVQYTIFNGDGSAFSINNYYLKPETYSWAFKTAGFSDFTWEGPFLNPQQKENPFWDDLLTHVPLIGLRAIKK